MQKFCTASISIATSDQYFTGYMQWPKIPSNYKQKLWFNISAITSWFLLRFSALFKLLEQPQSARCLQFHAQPPALLWPADPHGGREQKQRGRGLRAEPALRRAQPGGPALPLRPLVRNSPRAISKCWQRDLPSFWESLQGLPLTWQQLWLGWDLLAILICLGLFLCRCLFGFHNNWAS